MSPIEEDRKEPPCEVSENNDHSPEKGRRFGVLSVLWGALFHYEGPVYQYTVPLVVFAVTLAWLVVLFAWVLT